MEVRDDSDARHAFNHHTVSQPVSRLAALLLLALLLCGCAVPMARPNHVSAQPTVTDGHFSMADGTLLPYRAWLPAGPPRAVVLALHGMNDSRDAWEYPAPDFASAGIAVFSPDQRGFGATPKRGNWSGSDDLAADARQMATVLHARFPHTRLILMGESMGAAVLMLVATQPPVLPVDGYILVSPAVWERAEMTVLQRTLLWVLWHTVPEMKIVGSNFVRVKASDNREALLRLSEDPLTIFGTRVDSVHAMVDLMDAAVAAAPHFKARGLFLYGGQDELIPKQAAANFWRALPGGAREAYYPAGYHLLLRDHERITPIEDILAWIAHPDLPLPSGADRAAAAWLREQARD